MGGLAVGSRPDATANVKYQAITRTGGTLLGVRTGGATLLLELVTGSLSSSG